MLMKKATWLMVTIVTAALALTGCGGEADSPRADYSARRSVIEALRSERELDDRALATLDAMAAGGVPLAEGLNTLSGQTGALLDLIEDVSCAPNAENRYLLMAQRRLKTYLRERIFQIESTLGAQSPAEASETYRGQKAPLDKARDDVRGMLFKYDPALEKTVP